MGWILSCMYLKMIGFAPEAENQSCVVCILYENDLISNTFTMQVAFIRIAIVTDPMYSYRTNYSSHTLDPTLSEA